MKKHLLAICLLLAGTLLASMLPPSAAAQMTPVFGPTQYTRGTGKPQTFTAAFNHCGTQQCQIVVVNGEANGQDRVSSGSISLNGKQIISPIVFKKQADKIVKPVKLADQNQLTTKLSSKPGTFITVDVECATSPVVLELTGPGVNVPDPPDLPTTLLSAVLIGNTGTADAQNVEATAITLPGGTLTSPASLPSNLGTIPVEGSTVLDADFSGGPFTHGDTYPLTVTGTYAVGKATYCFTLSTDLVVPPAAPGSATLGTVQVQSYSVSGGGFPEEPPDFDEEVNSDSWTVPTAPFVPGTPTPTPTTVTPAVTQPDPIVFDVNNSMGMTSNAVAAEPSGAVTGKNSSKEGFVFATANWTAAYSSDETTFTQLNPSAVFPKDEFKFCCDQIVHYAPSIDRIIWLLQNKPRDPSGEGGYRLAVATPEHIISKNGNSWTYWKLTPSLFGEPTVRFDYPDLSVGDNYLYISWDVSSGGFQVARIKLADIKQADINGGGPGGSITIEYTNPSDGTLALSGHLMQDTGDEIFWAGQKHNSKLRVFSVAEGSNKYYWRNVGIFSWANNTNTSKTLDHQDWLLKIRNNHAVRGATRNGDQLWFAWTAGTDSNFPQSHVEMVNLERYIDPSDGNNNYHLIQQGQIWNKDHAFAYAALATNACTKEVGLSLEYGGNGLYENHVVGFWEDFTVYNTTDSDVGTDRFGDYVTIQQAPRTDANPGNLFAAFGYGVNKDSSSKTGTRNDIRYVRFGRPASSCAGK